MAKLNPSGSALVYSTYLGGSSNDDGIGIAVDAAGNAYVTGYTDLSDFPTLNPLQPLYKGNQDAFVAKLNPTGSALVYSTYLGGSEADWGCEHCGGLGRECLCDGAYILSRLPHPESTAAGDQRDA